MSTRQRVEKFFLEPASAEPLVALRIALASILLWQGLRIAPDIFALFGGAGILQSELNGYLTLPLGAELPRIGHLVALGIPEPIALRAVFLVYLVALAWLAVGFRARLAALAAWATHGMLLTSGYFASYGADRFAQIGLFYLICFPITRDAAPSARARLGLRVFQVHLCIAYFAAGVEKALGSEWWNGEAIWRALMLPHYGRFDVHWLASVPGVAVLLAWGTLFLEIGYPIFVWPRRTRGVWCVAILAMHAGIAVALGLVSFSLVMCALTACAFGLAGRAENVIKYTACIADSPRSFRLWRPLPQ